MTELDDYPCSTFVEDVTAYLEGVLPAETAARIDAHLHDCPSCREYLAQMRRTIAAVGRLAGDDIDALPADVRSGLVDAFRRARES